MKIDFNLLEAQITTLSKQLDKELTETEREHIEGLLNFLGEFSDANKEEGERVLFARK